VQAIQVMGPADHENGVTVLRGHAPQFDGLPPDESNAVSVTASMQAVLAARRAALDALSARLEGAKPAALRHPRRPQPEEEIEA
jgi:putative DNA primase/helicase